MGLDEHETEIYTDDKFPNPNITEDYTTFLVIGDIAKGYNHIAIESWDGDKVDIPNSYLKGHTPKDFFVLCIKGDSMYIFPFRVRPVPLSSLELFEVHWQKL